MNYPGPSVNTPCVMAANYQQLLMPLVENIGVEPMTFPTQSRDALVP